MGFGLLRGVSDWVRGVGVVDGFRAWRMYGDFVWVLGVLGRSVVCLLTFARWGTA